MNTVEARLERLIQDMGITIVETPKLEMSLNACFHLQTSTIIVNSGLDPATRTCAIAHELGHAYYGHDCSTSFAEYQADQWAAQNLLTLDMVKTTSAECDGMPALIAAELGVTPELLATWMRLYEAGRIHRQYVAI